MHFKSINFLTICIKYQILGNWLKYFGINTFMCNHECIYLFIILLQLYHMLFYNYIMYYIMYYIIFEAIIFYLPLHAWRYMFLASKLSMYHVLYVIFEAMIFYLPLYSWRYTFFLPNKLPLLINWIYALVVILYLWVCGSWVRVLVIFCAKLQCYIFVKSIPFIYYTLNALKNEIP